MSIRGERVNWESLVIGDSYIMKTAASQQVLVQIDVKVVTGIGVTILDGQLKSLKKGRTFRKGDVYVADPAYAEFFEPAE